MRVATDDPLAGVRQALRDRDRRLRALAEPGCRTCHGQGQTSGYVGPGKTARYPCPCTGQADWQRD